MTWQCEETQRSYGLGRGEAQAYLPALLRQSANTPIRQQGSYRWAAARTTKSYKHTYGTLAALLRRLETLPSYRHSYVCLRAI